MNLQKEADEQTADFLTPQQPGFDELGGNLKQGTRTRKTGRNCCRKRRKHQAYADDSPRKYVVKLLKEENESLKSLIHQQATEIETLKAAKAQGTSVVDETPSWPEDDLTEDNNGNDNSTNNEKSSDEISKLKEELLQKTNLAALLEKDLEESRAVCEKQKQEIDTLEKKKKKALERAKRAKEDAAAVIRLQKKKDGGSGAKDAELEKLQLKTEELENVKQEQEQKIKELHSALLMAKKDADERKNKESEETKNKAKEVLKKTNEKYKKLIHGLKARHKEEIASLETSIQASKKKR